MVRDRVSSTSIKSVGYNLLSSSLEIEFHSGSVYSYRNVPERVYNQLMAASSKGTYFNRHIKDVYNYRKVK